MGEFPFHFPSWEETEKQRRLTDTADILAQATASEVAPLRRALAEILVQEKGARSYGGCCCGDPTGKKASCLGHVPETVKIARSALGLPDLPDRARVPLPDDFWPERPKKKRKKKRKKGADA